MTNTRYALKNINLVNTSFLILTPIISISAIIHILYTQGFVWSQWLLALAFYFLTGFSITAGYHRLFSHRAYKAHPVVKLILLLFGAAAFQNSCLKWSADHRRHHTKVDSPEDPYNINEGFFFAHMGWVFLKEDKRHNKNLPKDLTSDKLIMWQHKYNMLIGIAMGLALPALLGHFLGSWWQGLMIAGVFRVVFVHHATFFINSLCHMVGNTPYSLSHSAKDSWLMAFFTYGEGYHNFHHTFQTDYRNGIKWYHYDPTKWLINSFKFFGLARDLKVTAPEDIKAAKLKVLVEKGLETSVDTGISDNIIALYEQMKENLLNQKRCRKQHDFTTLKRLSEQFEQLSLMLNHSFKKLPV